MTRATTAAAVLAALAALAACSSDDASSPPRMSATTPPSGTPSGGGDASTSADSGSSPSGDAGADADAGPAGRDMSTDRAKFFGASRCATAGLRLCEDFESGTLDKTTWSVVGKTPVIDGVQHARGSKALHVSLTGNGASYIKQTKTFPAKDDTYWGRMFVWFDKLPTSPGMSYAHWTFAAATGTNVTGEIRLSGQLQNGKNLFGVGTDSGGDPNGTGDWTTSDKDPGNKPLAVPTGQWLCVEWQHDGAKDETRFFWDAVEHPSLHTTSTVNGGNGKPYVMPEFTSAWVGWQEYQSSTEPFELWLDEVAFDDARIGCVL